MLILLQPGPFNSFVGMFSHELLIQLAAFTFAATVTTYNLLAIGLVMGEQHTNLLSCPPAAFSILAIVCFTTEQLGFREPRNSSTDT